MHSSPSAGPAASTDRRRGYRFVLASSLLGGVVGSGVGGWLVVSLLAEGGWLELAWSRPTRYLLFALVLASTLPVGLLAWALARRGRHTSAALLFLAVPLGAAVPGGLHPDILRFLGTWLLPYFLAATVLGLRRSRRSLPMAALAIGGLGAIWCGALLPPELDSRLRDAARSGDEQRVERLVRWGVAPDRGDQEGATPLMLAVEAGHQPVVRLLVDRGADPDRRDGSGRSARMRAIEGGRTALTLLFLGDTEVAVDDLDDSWRGEQRKPAPGSPSRGNEDG